MEWGNVCTQGVRARAGAPWHPSLQPSPDSHAASEAAGESPEPSTSTEGAEVVLKTEWGVGGGAATIYPHIKHQLTTSPPPSPGLGGLQSWEAGRTGKDHPPTHTHWSGGQQPENSVPLSLAPSPPPTVESGPASARPPPTPFYLISPVRLPEPGSPHLGQAGCGAPSRLPRAAGLGAGRRGSAAGSAEQPVP